MWEFFRPKKSEIHTLVEEKLRIKGAAAKEIAEATEIALRLTGGVIPPLALAKSAQFCLSNSVHLSLKGAKANRSRDLGVYTAFLYFRREELHDVLSSKVDGVAIRHVAIVELMTFGSQELVDDALSRAFWDYLDQHFGENASSEYRWAALKRWPDWGVIPDCFETRFDMELVDFLMNPAYPEKLAEEFVRTVTLLRTNSVSEFIDQEVGRFFDALARSIADDNAHLHRAKQAAFYVIDVFGGIAPAIQFSNDNSAPYAAIQILARLLARVDLLKQDKAWWDTYIVLSMAIVLLEPLAGVDRTTATQVP